MPAQAQEWSIRIQSKASFVESKGDRSTGVYVFVYAYCICTLSNKHPRQMIQKILERNGGK